MNESERAELEQLKRRIWQMRDQLATVGRDLESLEERLAQPPQPAEPQLPAIQPLAPTPIEATPAPQPPAVAQPPLRPVTPPPLPPVIVQRPPAPVVARTQAQPAQPQKPAPSVSEPQKEPSPALEALVAHRQARRNVPDETTRVPTSEATATPPAKETSFEMRLGTFWLVRIGIVMLLTGLVFFGAYAYQNFIPRLGPAGKVSLLYLASGVLLGVGAWLQRKEEKLRNYAQVLVAGGLAAVYFTTYAAHHIANLQIIESPLLDGALLLGWAGFVIWLADRTKSEVLALFAVLLAYYTSVITHIGLFTLYSNLVLTVAAVFFLVRNRWATLSFASLVATYASYAFWRFYQDGHWHWASPAEGLWAGNYFLISYWVIFTAALFLSKHEQFTGGRRATFLSLNNGAFFTAFILTMLQVHEGGFWKFSLVYGTVLIGLAGLAWRLRPEDKAFRNTYLTQGLLLVTLGFITYFTGLRLSLVLAAESVVLLLLGQQLQNRVMQIGAYAVAALAVGLCLPHLRPLDRTGLIHGVAIGAAMLFNATRFRKEATYEKSAAHPQTVFFTSLALLVWLVTSWQNTTLPWRGLVLAFESTLLLCAVRPLGNRFLGLGSLFFAGLAVGWQMFDFVNQAGLNFVLPLQVGWEQGALIGAAMLANALWQRHQSPLRLGQTFAPAVTLYTCLSLAAWLAVTWLFTPRDYLVPLLAVEALLFTVAFYPLRLPELTLFGQAFLILAQLLWMLGSGPEQPNRPWWNPVTVIAITLALSAWWQRQKALKLRLEIQQVLQGIYALAVVGLLYFWLEPRVTGPDWLAFASLLALALTAYGVCTRFWLLAAAGQILLVISGYEFVRQLVSSKPAWYLPLAPVFVLALLSAGTVGWFKRRPEAKPELAQPLLNVSLVYRVVALAMSLWWIYKYIPAREQCWVPGLIGGVLFLLAGWRRNQELLIFSGIFTITGVLRFWLPLDSAPAVYWPNLLVLLLLLAQQRIAKRWSDRYHLPAQAQAGIMVVGSLSLWLYLSRWVVTGADGFYLTATWSGLALVLFVLGMRLRERVYRWLGLGVLACAVGRVVFIDIWNLEIIYRILSFMALGIVLLVLGFLYNKYQDRIKEWL
ncbi:MAG: Membrane protein-like protein [Pedosphaera sp.]|nr:Membrane protein-like protein [Pedosphaera sp.]